MAYWGKVVGTVAGLATGQPLLAAVGLVLGHQFDRGFTQRFPRSGAGGANGSLANLPSDYIQALFQVMGHLAKADGRVSEDEIRAARSLMHRLGLAPAQARQAILWFEDGKRADFPLRETLRALSVGGARRREARSLFLRLLMEVSLAKGTLHQQERAVLWQVCTVFGVGRVELAQLEAILRAQRSFGTAESSDSDVATVTAAYRTLGVDRTASNDDIKKAYRRLMNRNHPDKIASGNPGDDAIAEAQRRTREIRAAYEMLKVRRSIR